MKEQRDRTGASRLASMLGLCRRAGRLACGVKDVENALKTARAHLVLLARDASDRAKKTVHDKCTYRGITPIPIPLTKAELGRACGLAEVSACAVLDREFTRAIAPLAEACDSSPAPQLE